MAHEWLLWRGRQLGLQFVDDQSSADVVFVTAAHATGAVRAVQRVRRCGRPIVVGGGGTWHPAWATDDVAGVCVGEGLEFLETLASRGLEAALDLDCVWRPGDTRPVVPSTRFDWDLPPILEYGRVVRVMASRGCPRRCLFCSTGWSRGFERHPHPVRLNGRIRGLLAQCWDVRLVTNDLSEDDWALIPYQRVASTRAQWVLEHLQAGTPLKRYLRTARIGVEGVSERLRRAINKPISHDDLITMLVGLTYQRVHTKVFMIAGLPGETATDWEEWMDVLRYVNRHAKRRINWSFTAYVPQPPTPLGVLPIDDQYWDIWQDVQQRYQFDGCYHRRNFIITRPSTPIARLREASINMAATEAELRRGWFVHTNRNWRVQYNATPAELRRHAVRYAEMMSMPPAAEWRASLVREGVCCNE